MKSGLSKFAVLTFAFAMISAIYSPSSLAQVATTNGYVCTPKNIGGEETRLYFRQQGGIADNIAPDATFPVVCPVVIDPFASSYGVVVGLKNNNSIGQTFSCALEENDLVGNTVRTIGKSVSLGGRTGGVLVWDNIFLSGDTNYFSLRCILPPKSGIAQISWYDFP